MTSIGWVHVRWLNLQQLRLLQASCVLGDQEEPKRAIEFDPEDVLLVGEFSRVKRRDFDVCVFLHISARRLRGSG